MRKLGKFYSASAAMTICFLTLWMIGLFSPGGAQDEGKVKIKTELINVAVVIKDADGKRVPDLKKEDFEIYEDGVLQEIAQFKPAPHPLRLILLFDTSVSMGAIFPAIKAEAVKLVEGLNQLYAIIVGAFNVDLQLSANWGGKGLATTEIPALKSTSSSQPTSPGPQPRLPSPFPIPRGRAAPDRNTNLFGAMHTLFERFGSRSGNEVVL